MTKKIQCMWNHECSSLHVNEISSTHKHHKQTTNFVNLKNWFIHLFGQSFFDPFWSMCDRCVNWMMMIMDNDWCVLVDVGRWWCIWCVVWWAGACEFSSLAPHRLSFRRTAGSGRTRPTRCTNRHSSATHTNMQQKNDRNNATDFTATCKNNSIVFTCFHNILFSTCSSPLLMFVLFCFFFVRPS